MLAKQTKKEEEECLFENCPEYRYYRNAEGRDDDDDDDDKAAACNGVFKDCYSICPVYSNSDAIDARIKLKNCSMLTFAKAYIRSIHFT